MFKKVIFLAVLIFSSAIFAQNFTKHTVVKGETITQIAQKYNVTPLDIYKNNPDAKNGLKIDGVLLIPTTKIVTPTKAITKQILKRHEVIAKETVYGIAKQYGITVKDLYQANAGMETNGIKIGQLIVIPNLNGQKTTPTAAVKEPKIHEVVAKETKYSIAKEYNISLEQLEKWNPNLGNNLAVGQKIIVSKPAEKTNPTLAPQKSESNMVVADAKKKYDLLKSLKKSEKKKLALLLPFNISKIEADSLTTKADRLKKDGFLNMTLDFYAGALMAIDSAKVLVLNVDISIFDSQETKLGSNVANIVKQNELKNFHAIIGPFYQSQADHVAEMVEENQVPVISPLSKEMGKSLTNMYNVTPSNEALKSGMINYLKQQKGNLIAVIDSKKTSIKDYISSNLEETKFSAFTEKNEVDIDKIKLLLSKEKTNFVIIASERTGLILNTMNTLIAFQPDYNIRLVILEPNPTLDYEEIPLAKLTKLKLTYPSLTKDFDTPATIAFDKSFRLKNKIAPNQYATRGFDVTFDTLLRLSQGITFEESIIEQASDQVENRFDYRKKNSGGYVNKGVYILQYNADLTISSAE